MLKLIFNKDDSLFFEKKASVISGSTSRNNAKFRFAIHPQGIRQFNDNCKIAKCHIVASLTFLSKMSFNIEYSCHTIINIKHE